MLKYIGNAFHNILPSVIATCIGAYIVNHYINKPDTPPAPVAAVSPASEPKKPEETPAKATTGDAKLAVAPTDAGAGEAPAKGKAAEKADKPARLHQPNPREKLTAEKAPAKPAAAPATVAAVNSAPPVEANPARDERRDANDLARAAIERLRNSGNSSEAPRAAVESAPRLPERAQELPRAAPTPAANPVAGAPTVTAPVASAAPVAPLPPAVNVVPPVAAVDLANHPATTASVAARTDDPLRLTPPEEIPTPVEAKADAGRSIRTVGDDVFSAARSVIHAVIPR